MIAVMPISSPKYASVLRPATSGSHEVSPTDGAVIAAVAVLVLATLAPSIALAVALVATIGSVAWLGLRVAAHAPQALLEANRNALARATATQISFAR
jgi:hypothetical protein